MDNSIYIALSRQTALFRQMDVVANNVANASTDGFRSERVIFNDYVANAGKRDKISFTQDIGTSTNLEQGPIRRTDRDLDVAIQGKGFFSVATPLGTRYTRSGAFTINQEGNLTTKEGYNVLDQGGQPIAFEEDDKDITIREDGTVTIANSTDERGKIGVVKFENEALLRHTAGGLFTSDEAPQAAELTTDYEVIQGSLETSNVNSIREMTEMIDVSRSVNGVGRFMLDAHELQRRAVSVISRQQ
jgi:flagellar basal-body rod protein FlgF